MDWLFLLLSLIGFAVNVVTAVAVYIVMIFALSYLSDHEGLLPFKIGPRLVSFLPVCVALSILF